MRNFIFCALLLFFSACGDAIDSGINDLDIYIPNALVQSNSNNGNSVLIMHSRLNFTYDLEVIDRSGNVVFKNVEAITNIPMDGWRPVNLQAGIYTYLLSFDLNGVRTELTGDVTLFE